MQVHTIYEWKIGGLNFWGKLWFRKGDIIWNGEKFFSGFSQTVFWSCNQLQNSDIRGWIYKRFMNLVKICTLHFWQNVLLICRILSTIPQWVQNGLMPSSGFLTQKASFRFFSCFMEFSYFLLPVLAALAAFLTLHVEITPKNNC